MGEGRTKWLVAASALFAFSYMAIWNLDLPQPVPIIWKGLPVALLALAAAGLAKGTDGWLLAAVLGLGALGDMLLELSLVAGALAFMAGHGVAIWLYARNRRGAMSGSQKALVLLVVPLSVAIAWMLPADRAGAAGVAVYALCVAAMAAMAWRSRFPRLRTGLGAMLFLISDLVIFARMGPAAGALWPAFVIWALYYGGQLLIFAGVSGTLGSVRHRA
ncbi:lysoplasmalogenase family protein [Sphingobium boeckii]|uniref:Putative membrane protein YhhN n=1 Tax=Sphingobium boeckii TaxID=1082345 RepID=A0A7W9AKQ4_9SPHN|nr:lysoplasmalogenase family protein [Sphingobium boeckii]MBB5687271.1 putative membrane protein YhhN [Sphingobium boeckii]